MAIQRHKSAREPDVLIDTDGTRLVKCEDHGWSPVVGRHDQCARCAGPESFRGEGGKTTYGNTVFVPNGGEFTTKSGQKVVWRSPSIREIETELRKPGGWYDRYGRKDG